VRACYDGVAVLDERLVLLQPVRVGAGETVEVKGTGPVEYFDLVHHVLDGAAELPRVVGGEVALRRNEDLVAVTLGGLHECLDVGDGAVCLDAFANEAPTTPCLLKKLF